MGHTFEPPPLPPLPGLQGGDLDEMRRRRRNRVAVLLLTVPFSFPVWFRLRRQDPDLARRLIPALAANIAQDVLVVLMAVCLVWFSVNRDAIVEALSDRLAGWMYGHGGLR